AEAAGRALPGGRGDPRAGRSRPPGNRALRRPAGRRMGDHRHRPGRCRDRCGGRGRPAGNPVAEPPRDRVVAPAGRARRGAEGPGVRPRARAAAGAEDDPVNLSNDDVQDILSLLDSLPYSELTLETSRFTLQLRRSAGDGWTQETQVLSQPVLAGPV